MSEGSAPGVGRAESIPPPVEVLAAIIAGESKTRTEKELEAKQEVKKFERGISISSLTAVDREERMSLGSRLVYQRSLADLGSDRILKHPHQGIENDYEIGRLLGVPGAYGRANEAIFLATEEQFVVKTINKSQREIVHLDMFRQEVKVMQEMDHPNVIHYRDVYEDDDNLYIVMEKCSGGDLFEDISARKQYGEADAQALFRQMLEAVKYCHDQNIVHCDLKPDNFVFFSEQQRQLKMLDFGMSKHWNPRSRELFRSPCGTAYYAAPEVVERKYNLACDMWSMGVILFIMLVGYPPFYVDERKIRKQCEALGKPATTQSTILSEIRKKVVKGFKPKVQPNVGPWFPTQRPISQAAMDLISHLLVIDVAERYTAKQALCHRWISGDVSQAPLAPIVLASLIDFKIQQTYQEVVLNVFTDLLTDDEFDELETTFAEIDENSDGFISIEEFEAAMTKKQWTHESLSLARIEDIFNNCDLNRDGVLCYEEILSAMIHFKLLSREERLSRAFRALDTNEDNYITASELCTLVKGEGSWRSGMAIANSIISGMDTDGDHRISYDEFLAAWREHEGNFPF